MTATLSPLQAILEKQGDGTSPEASPHGVPTRYEPLLARLGTVRPDCARVAALAITEKEGTGAPYDLEFFRRFVERMERQDAPDPSKRVPVQPEPYTRADLRRHVEGCFARSAGHWDALVEAERSMVCDVLDLAEALLARLASWGLHGRDVKVSTAGPDGAPAPHDHTRALGSLVTGLARLAKDLADQEAGRYAADTPRRLERDYRNIERDLEGARRVLTGGPFQLPAPPDDYVGDRMSWWAVVEGPGKPKGKAFAIKRGRRMRAFAEREGVRGPFATKRLASDAAKRALATPEDSMIGLFAPFGPFLLDPHGGE